MTNEEREKLIEEQLKENDNQSETNPRRRASFLRFVKDYFPKLYEKFKGRKD